MQQEEGEPLKLYVYRYSVIHKMVIGLNAVQTPIHHDGCPFCEVSIMWPSPIKFQEVKWYLIT